MFIDGRPPLVTKAPAGRHVSVMHRHVPNRKGEVPAPIGLSAPDPYNLALSLLAVFRGRRV